MVRKIIGYYAVNESFGSTLKQPGSFNIAALGDGWNLYITLNQKEEAL